MTFEESKARTTEKASYATFEKFERMYMAGHIDKDVFCKLMKPLVVAETEAAPFENEAAARKIDFIDALAHAKAALDNGESEAVLMLALTDAKTFGIAYMNARRKADAFYVKI